LILLAGNVLASSQWLISRAFAARGKPLLLLWSYGLSVLTMCSLDVLLIPGLGLAGAALAAVVGPAAGLLFCLIAYCRTHEPHARVRDLIPRVEDFRFLWARGFRHLSMGARWGLGLVRGRGNVP
jgi:Na+-driven multidrug efflux pump